MNTPATIGTIVLAVVVIGGGIWYAVTHPIDRSMETASETATGESKAGEGTLADLWTIGGSVKCEVSSGDETAPFSGTVYASGGKMRVDAITKIPQIDRTVNTHMVRADGFLYTWSDMLPQGIKIAEPKPDAAGNSTPTVNGVAGSTKVTYSCAPWIADASILTPPADITFKEVPAAQ
jgi:hypothetical protein